MTKSRLVACPHCKNLSEFSPSNQYRPFCSERCKMIDFGVWASEGYAIPDNSPVDPLDEELN